MCSVMCRLSLHTGESLLCNLQSYISHEGVSEWPPLLLMGFLWVVCECDTQRVNRNSIQMP